MMDNFPETEAPKTDRPTTQRASWRRRPRRLLFAAVAAPLLLGAAGLSLARPGEVSLAPVTPIAVGSLVPARSTAARGDVAEIFGNKFVVQDGTGRVLVETGRRGEDGTLVKAGETVTVQGRFEHGFLHAAVITRTDGSRILLGPAAGEPKPSAFDWAKDKIGLGPRLDVPALTALVERAGYSEVRVTGSGPRHVTVAAKGQDGREHALHVDVDGRIREK